jgi:hypothetical protein
VDTIRRHDTVIATLHMSYCKYNAPFSINSHLSPSVITRSTLLSCASLSGQSFLIGDCFPNIQDLIVEKTIAELQISTFLFQRFDCLFQFQDCRIPFSGVTITSLGSQLIQSFLKIVMNLTKPIGIIGDSFRAFFLSLLENCQFLQEMRSGKMKMNEQGSRTNTPHGDQHTQRRGHSEHYWSSSMIPRD